MVLALKRSDEPRVEDVSIPPDLVLAGGYRPSWLLTCYGENTWVVTDVGDKPNQTIRFDVRLPSGKYLSDYPVLLQDIKRIIYGSRTGPLISTDSGYQQKTCASSLIVLARWMISNGIGRFSDLTLADAHEYAELAAYGVNAILNAESILNRYIEERLKLACFDESDTPAVRRAKAIRVFPAYPNSKSNWVLNREVLLEAAGLGGVPPRGATLQALDHLESLCEFYRSPEIRRRIAKAATEEALDEMPVSTARIAMLLSPFELLFKHRRYLEDGLQRKLFRGTERQKLINRLGKPVGRTGTVPVIQAATLIERSIRWVVSFAPILLALHEGKDVPAAHLPDGHGPDSPFPILKRDRLAPVQVAGDNTLYIETIRQGMTLTLALNFLMTACAVVIAAFSARRAAEIIGLKVGCIEDDDTGKPWMQVFIHKTTKGTAVIPVPEVVREAVLVLERLSTSARASNGTPYIFQFKSSGIEKARGVNDDGFPVFALGVHLQKFGYFVDVPALPGGTKWTFAPHQFRRLFAILYIWIYELGDWGTLSFHLRHFNPEMTRRYATDEELGHIVAIANKEHTAEILTKAALGKVKVSGVEGTRFKDAAKRLYDRMTQQLQVVPERKLTQRITRLVERTGMTLHALPWGYCASSNKGEERSLACSNAEEPGPDFSAATFSSCKDCAYGFRTPAFIPYLQSSLKLHMDISRSESTPIIMRRASEILSRDICEYIESIDMPDKGAAK